MRRVLVTAIALAGSAKPALCDVTIAEAATQNISCVSGVCTPNATDAVLNVNDLETMLASGNVTVTTTGASVQARDVRISTRLAWSSPSTLALEAYRSIAVEKAVTVSGPGGVSITTNDGGTNGEFSCDKNGRLTFKNLSSALVINGTSYTLLNSLAALATAIAANPTGDYAFARAYDASADGTYAAPPILTVFAGSFNGLGNAILNLTINDPTDNSYVGLFAETAGGSNIANVRLQNENVTGAAGDTGYSSTEYVGGLIGYASGGAISHSFVTGSVTSGSYSAIGGMIGISESSVAQSGAAMSVTMNGQEGDAGGLIGGANGVGAVLGSFATGDVTGGGFVGGLVGFNAAPLIADSHSTGEVSGNDNETYAGGLAGINQTTISRSYSTGSVSCILACGGLVGFLGGGADPAGASIRTSFATGSVTGITGGAGGLVGWNQLSTISDSYATGPASGPTAGGLVSANSTYDDGANSIARSYSSGAVSGSIGSTGGLIGYDEAPSALQRTYWDMTTSGVTDPSQGAGNVNNDPGIKGLSNTHLQSGLPRGFNAKVWGENSGINGGLPYLLNNPPP